jgi:hypothetical protein
MSNEPFGRQPAPYTIIICCDDGIDLHERVREFKRYCERAGDTTHDLAARPNEAAFRVYPRAVND